MPVTRSLSRLRSLFILAGLCVICVETALVHSEKELIDRLLSNHSKFARPVKNISRPVIVEFGAEIVQIQDLMMPQQTLKTSLWIRMKWKNELMSWNPDDYGGLSLITLDSQSVWVPDIVLYNRFEADGSTDEMDKSLLKTKIRLDSDGTTYWNSPLVVVSTCRLDVGDFPFDTQLCTLKFGPWNSDASKVDVTADRNPMTTSNYLESSEWTLVEATKKRSSNKYSCCVYPYTDVTVTVKLRRKSLFYLFNFVVPYAVLLFCVLVGYFLPPHSGERIALSLTIYLAFSILIQTSSGYLPRSAELSALSIFYFIIMNELALSVLTTCVVINVHYTSEWSDKVSMPKWIEIHVLQRFETVFQKLGLLSSNSEWQNYHVGSTLLYRKYSSFLANLRDANNVDEEEEDQPIGEEHRSATSNILERRDDLTCHQREIEFRTMKKSNHEEEDRHSTSTSSSIMKSRFSPKLNHCNEMVNLADSVARFDDGNDDAGNCQPTLQSILSLMKSINEQTITDMISKENGDKWKRLAMVLDRLSFVFFTFFTLCVMLAFTVIKPAFL